LLVLSHIFSFPVRLGWPWTQRLVWQPTVSAKAQLLRRGPMCSLGGVCTYCLCINDVLCCSKQGRFVVYVIEHLVQFIYIVSSAALSFTGCWAYLLYIRQAHCVIQVPPAFPARSVYQWPQGSVQPAVITANAHYDPGALIHECNDLSQIIEDIDEPSIPVQEFNLTAASLPNRAKKTHFQTLRWIQDGESSQPISPAGTVDYL